MPAVRESDMAVCRRLGLLSPRGDEAVSHDDSIVIVGNIHHVASHIPAVHRLRREVLAVNHVMGPTGGGEGRGLIGIRHKADAFDLVTDSGGLLAILHIAAAPTLDELPLGVLLGTPFARLGIAADSDRAAIAGRSRRIETLAVGIGGDEIAIMVGLACLGRLMAHPPGVLPAGRLADIVYDGGAGLHASVLPCLVDVGMPAVVEGMDQFWSGEIRQGEGERTNAVLEIGLEHEQLVDAVVILPKDQSALVVVIDDWLSAGIVDALAEVDACIGHGERRKREDAAVQRHVVVDSNGLGIDIDVARDLAEVFFVASRTIPVVPHHVFDVDLGSKRVHGLFGTATHEQFRFFIRIVIVPDDIPMPVMLAYP